MSVTTLAAAANEGFAPDNNERALLGRLGELLEREEAMVAVKDLDGILAVAEERERITSRLANAAQVRRLAASGDDDAELIDLYVRLRQRHDVRAQVLHRHAQRSGQAIGVLAQAGGRDDLYAADGRVKLRFLAA